MIAAGYLVEGQCDVSLLGLDLLADGGVLVGLGQIGLLLAVFFSRWCSCLGLLDDLARLLLRFALRLEERSDEAEDEEALDGESDHESEHSTARVSFTDAGEESQEREDES